jgi:glucokinase
MSVAGIDLGDVAGAIGWLALDRPFMPRYVQHGCFEDQASGPGLVRVARDLIDADTRYGGELAEKSELDAADIFAAHGRGDAVASRVIDNAIELWEWQRRISSACSIPR